MALLNLDDPRKRIPPHTFSLWALGFRPFYLLAAGFAALAVPLWVAILSGAISVAMPGLWWHAHEMLFGFAAAVIVGFLFTAGRNWTGQPTPTDGSLAALAGVWLCGRLAMALDGGWMALVIDVAFLPLAALALGRALVRAGSRRNYFFPVILLAMAGANLIFHAARLNMLMVDPVVPLRVTLGLIVMIETIMGGRVIPTFTASALRGGSPIRQWQAPWLSRASIALTGISLLAWALEPALGWGVWFAPLALVAAVLQLARTLGWNGWAARRVPLVWILHLGHLWIAVGLGLVALSAWGLVPLSAAVHAFAIGATGGLIIGMITRTALGHTGRMLVASPVETSAYVLIQCAAVARVLTLVALPLAATRGVHVAAALWSLGFLLYLWRYLPWLIRARIDGQPG
jgi:uncharacterized protein involved in response to NO